MDDLSYEKERLEEFEADVRKLKTNAEWIPKEQLTKKYAAAYRRLQEKVRGDGVWLTNTYLRAVLPPVNPEDARGNAWLKETADGIIQSELLPDGLYDRALTALTEELNTDRFFELIAELWSLLCKEAYAPYMARQNVRTEDGGWYNKAVRGRWNGDRWVGADGGTVWRGFPPTEGTS